VLIAASAGMEVANRLVWQTGCQNGNPAALLSVEGRTAMDSNAGIIVRVLKRLRAAVGYHELGMTQHALRCLDGLVSLEKIGPFGLVVDILRHEFVKSQENNVSAAKALETVACMLPMPARNAIQATLAVCDGETPESARAANLMAGARGVKPEGKPKSAC
jgi:hypothetical protein